MDVDVDGVQHVFVRHAGPFGELTHERGFVPVKRIPLRPIVGGKVASGFSSPLGFAAGSGCREPRFLGGCRGTKRRRCWGGGGAHDHGADASKRDERAEELGG